MLTNEQRDEIKKALEEAAPGRGYQFGAKAKLLANAPTWLKQQDEMIEQLLKRVEGAEKSAAMAWEAHDNMVDEVKAKDAEIEKLKAFLACETDAYQNIKAAEEQTKAALAIAVEALEWYAEAWGKADIGNRARNALSQVSKE